MMILTVIKMVITMNNFYGAKLNDCFVDVFDTLKKDTRFDTIFAKFPDVVTLDLEYQFVHSGEKTVNKLVSNSCNEAHKKVVEGLGISYVSDYFRRCFTSIVYSRFFIKWGKLIHSLDELRYDVVNPYSINSSKTITGNNKDVIDRTDVNTSSSMGTSNSDRKSEVVDKSGVYGFNSNNAVDSDVSNSNENDTNTSTSNTTNNSTTDVDSSTTKTINEHHTDYKSGNLGNIASQDLIKKEFELRRIQLLDIIFADVDSVITRLIYD